MSEQSFDTPIDYRDRRAHLIISGIVLALVGCLLGLLSAVYIVLFGMADSVLFAGPPGTVSPADILGEQMQIWIIAAGVIYGALGAVFLVVGAGNIFLKRWSRPLALILTGCWGYMGVSMLAWSMVSYSKMRQFMYAEMDNASGGLPPGMSMDGLMGIMIAVNLALIFIFGIMLPVTVFWLNLSRDAKATVEFCDRKTRWTDRCPVPVLGIAVVCAAGGLMFIGSAFWMPFMPVFGHILTGQKAVLAMLAISAILLVVAWGAYRRQIVAWALALVTVVGFSISGVVSLFLMDWSEMYRLMGVPVESDELLEMNRMMEMLYSGNSTIVGMILAMLPVLAYLVWALRFFRKDDGGAIPASAAEA